MLCGPIVLRFYFFAFRSNFPLKLTLFLKMKAISVRFFTLLYHRYIIINKLVQQQQIGRKQLSQMQVLENFNQLELKFLIFVFVTGQYKFCNFTQMWTYRIALFKQLSLLSPSAALFKNNGCPYHYQQVFILKICQFLIL